MNANKVIQEIRDEMNTLRGRMFGACEATGMPEKQESAFKNLIRQQTYETQRKLESTIRRNGKE
jgi:hypothetical protein